MWVPCSKSSCRMLSENVRSTQQAVEIVWPTLPWPDGAGVMRLVGSKAGCITPCTGLKRSQHGNEQGWRAGSAYHGAGVASRSHVAGNFLYKAFALISDVACPPAVAQ